MNSYRATLLKIVLLAASLLFAVSVQAQQNGVVQAGVDAIPVTSSLTAQATNAAPSDIESSTGTKSDSSTAQFALVDKRKINFTVDTYLNAAQGFDSSQL